MFLGGPNPSNPGFLSIQMKVVENTKNNDRKNTVNVRIQSSKGVKSDALGVKIYRCLGFLSTQMKVVENPQKPRKS